MATMLCAFILPQKSYSQIGIEANYGLNGVFEPSINDLSGL